MLIVSESKWKENRPDDGLTHLNTSGVTSCVNRAVRDTLRPQAEKKSFSKWCTFLDRFHAKVDYITTCQWGLCPNVIIVFIKQEKKTSKEERAKAEVKEVCDFFSVTCPGNSPSADRSKLFLRTSEEENYGLRNHVMASRKPQIHHHFFIHCNAESRLTELSYFFKLSTDTVSLWLFSSVSTTLLFLHFAQLV